MKRFLMFMIFAMVFMAASAQAASGKMYFAGNAGVSIPADIDDGPDTISFDPGFNVTLAMGYDFGMIRAEGEIGYRMFDIDTATGPGFPPGVTGDVNALTFMANGYYDFEMGSPLSPYVGVGLGFVTADIELTAPGFGTLEISSDEFAYQFMAGAGYEISSTTVLTAGYRFFADTDSDPINIHEFVVGARYMF